MIGHLWKLALVVALSHGYRVVGRTVGPRWAGLITALPCSTAVALLGGGSDRGVGYAVAMANTCWVGLAGASALPLAFASATVAGWGLIAIGFAGGCVVFRRHGRLAEPGPGRSAATSRRRSCSLVLATWLATRMGDPVAREPDPGVNPLAPRGLPGSARRSRPSAWDSAIVLGENDSARPRPAAWARFRE